MAEAVYLLCAITSVVCAALLFRGYRASKTRLLFWSSLCFAGLALNNILLFADLVLFPTLPLTIWRTAVAFVAILVLLFGLVWEAR
jgi:hypothetical protein